MNRWKGSLGIKLLAWVLITLCGIAFAGSCLMILALHDLNIYDYTSEERFRQSIYEDAADQYSVIALDQYLRDQEAEEYGKQRTIRPDEIELNDTYFRYGIIKADNIDEVDFNRSSVYVRNNFTEHVDAEKLYRVSHEVNEDTEFSASALLGRYSVYSEIAEKIISDPIYNICCNVEDGIFYYEGTDCLYPVREVEIGWTTGSVKRRWNFAYDFEKKAYRNLGATDLTDEMDVDMESSDVPGSNSNLNSDSVSLEVTDAAAAGADLTGLSWEEKAEWFGLSPDEARSLGRQIDERLLQNEYLTFNEFDMLTSSYLQIFDYVKLDGRNYLWDEGKLIYTYYEGDMLPITEERDYWLDENELKINYPDRSATDTYWIVSLMPEEVRAGWGRDLFMQANMLVTYAYGLRYGVYVILFVSLGLGVALFVWLIAAAGHRKGTEAIVTTWPDRIPFDLFLLLATVTEWLPALMISVIGIRIAYEPARIVLPAFLLLCMCWVLLYTILSFAVRVKLGAWWKHTILWRLCRFVFRLLKGLAENMTFLWKALVAALLLSAVEFSVVIRGGFGPIARFWLMERAVLLPLFLMAVLQMQKLKDGAAKMAGGDLENQIETASMFWEFRKHGENLNSISDGIQKAVAESVKSERFKTELITNVSHDIKTPLTSIINYVDLLGKEELDNENAKEYLEVLARQSNRLKKLIEDLMEASKASTGNLTVNLERLEAGVSMTQTVGEFEEKLQANQLALLVEKPDEPVYIMADARHFWRVIDNLMNNICKYAQPGTRVYIDLKTQGERAVITFRNTSKYALNISPDELMERFVRGDSSRNTEGSGLGLSIARSLMELMNGTFDIYVDGDLFKVVLGIPLVTAQTRPDTPEPDQEPEVPAAGAGDLQINADIHEQPSDTLHTGDSLVKGDFCGKI